LSPPSTPASYLFSLLSFVFLSHFVSSRPRNCSLSSLLAVWTSCPKIRLQASPCRVRQGVLTENTRNSGAGLEGRCTHGAGCHADQHRRPHRECKSMFEFRPNPASPTGFLCPLYLQKFRKRKSATSGDPERLMAGDSDEEDDEVDPNLGSRSAPLHAVAC